MIHEDEQLDDLWRGELKILQKKTGFKYGIDAVVLAQFVKLKPKQQVLDIGTGSGIIPILLAGKYPDNHITALEIQPAYAEMAQRSVELNQLEHVKVVEGDAKRLVQDFGKESFDVVVSNPPYYNKSIRSQRPDKAIARSEILITLPQLIEQAAGVLKPRGSLYLIYHPGRLTDLMSQLHKHQLELKAIRFIHPAADKEANMVLLRATKGGGKEARILPPLFVYQNGDYTQEIYDIYNDVQIEKERP